MKKFFCSTILIFAVVLICAACGSTEKKENGDAVAKSEDLLSEDDWIFEWIKSNSSDEELCAVGSVETTKMFTSEAMNVAIMNAQTQLCFMIAQGKEGCELPAVKMKGQRRSRADEDGMITVYVLVCIDRKDLEGNRETEKETYETDKTDEDKVVQ